MIDRKNRTLNIPLKKCDYGYTTYIAVKILSDLLLLHFTVTQMSLSMKAKLIYNLFLLHFKKAIGSIGLLGLLLFTSCQSDDNPVMEERIYNLIVRDVFYPDNILSTDRKIEIYNGTKLEIQPVDQNNSLGSIDKIEIKNSSNPNVKILPYENTSRVLLKTEEDTDQELTLDLFYEGEKKATLDITLKVVYGIKKDGEVLQGEQKLTFNNRYTPVNLEIFRLDGQELDELPVTSASVDFIDDIEFEIIENYEIFSGNNFKLVFNPFQDGATTKTLSLYYFTNTDIGNRNVFVKDFEIEVTYEDSASCIEEEVNQSILFPGNTEPSLEYGLVYKKENTRYISVRSSNCVSGCAERRIFYDTQGNIIELESEAEYKYDANNLLIQSTIFSNSSDGITSYFYHSYDNDQQRTSKVHYKGEVRRDSIVYKDYINGKYTKYYKYDENNVLTHYAENVYDTAGNLIRQDGSSDGNINRFNYYTEYEYSTTYTRRLYPVEGNRSPVIYEDALFFIEEPVITRRTIFDLDQNRVDFEETFVSYTSQGNQTTIDFEYVFSDPTRVYKRTYGYIDSACN